MPLGGQAIAAERRLQSERSATFRGPPHKAEASQPRRLEVTTTVSHASGPGCDVLCASQVDRRALPRADWSLKVVPPYVAPRTKLEREVQLLWQTVLNQPAMISVEADFTQQGGGMMHAVVVNGIIRYALH